MSRLAVLPVGLMMLLGAACGSTAVGSDIDAAPPDANAPDAIPPPDAFLPPPKPMITSVAPDRGPMAGGTELTITGTGFMGTEMVIFNGVLIPSTTVNATTITATTTVTQTSGAVDILVFNNVGFDSLTGGFTYNEAPTVTAISPSAGTGAGGEPVTVTGTGFMNFSPGDNVVAIGGAACIDVVVASDTELSCTTGVALVSCVTTSVTVENANGSASLPDAFTYGGSFYGVGGRGGTAASGILYNVDACTGLTTVIGTIGYQLSGSGFHSGTLYGSQVNGFSGGVMNLISIDTTTGLGTIVGALSTATGSNHPHVTDLSSDGTTMYGWTEAGDDLISVNTTNGQVTVIPSTIGSAGSGMAADAAGVLYGTWSGACGALRTIDKVTGTGTTVVTMNGAGCNGIMGLTWYNGSLYGVKKEYPGTSLVKINTTTGLVTVIGTVGGMPDRMEDIASSTP